MLNGHKICVCMAILFPPKSHCSTSKHFQIRMCEKKQNGKSVCVYQPHQVKINDGHFRFNLLLLLLLLYTWLVIISAVWLSINRPKFSRSLSSKKTKQQKHWKSEAHFSFRQTSSHQFRWSHEKRTPNTAYTQLCEMWMWKMAYLRIGYIGSLLTKYRTEQFFFLCGYFFNVGKWVDKMSQILCALFIFFSVGFLSSSPSSSSF